MPRHEQKVMAHRMNDIGIYELAFGTQRPNNVCGKNVKQQEKDAEKTAKCQGNANNMSIF